MNCAFDTDKWVEFTWSGEFGERTPDVASTELSDQTGSRDKGFNERVS